MDVRDAFALAEHLLERHGLHDWSVELDSAKRRAGVCRFGPRVVGLSAPMTALHSEKQVQDTILHEIAHALVGPRHGHDAVWRRTALAIGCSGERCVPGDAPAPATPWLGVCSAGHTVGRHRGPVRVLTCSRCADTWRLEHVFTWTHHGRPAVMHPNYDEELRHLREGRRWHRLTPGARGRITVAGPYAGRVGVVRKRGTSRYTLAVGRTVVTVPFAGVEPV